MLEFLRFLQSATNTFQNTNVQIDVNKFVNVDANIDANADVDDNSANLIFDVEAVGPETFAEADVSVLVLDGALSSISGSIFAATDEPEPDPTFCANFSFVVDGSNSIVPEEYADHLAAVQASIDDLRTRYDEEDDVDVHLVQFSGNFGPSGLPATREDEYDLFDDALDNVADLAVFDPQIAATPPLGPQTNWEAALDEAVEFFEGNADDEDCYNAMLFISDGSPNRPLPFSNDTFLDEVQELEDLGVERVAVTFDPGAGQTEMDELNLIDSDGDAMILDDPALIVDIFPPDDVPADLAVA